MEVESLTYLLSLGTIASGNPKSSGISFCSAEIERSDLSLTPQIGPLRN